jgi:hypothetical protein
MVFTVIANMAHPPLSIISLPIIFFVFFGTDADKQWFNARVCKLLGENLGIRWEVDDVFVKQNIMWGDFLKPGADPRNYEEARDPKAMLKLMDDYLDDFNGSSSNGMKLVFFDDAIRHVQRIVRIVRQPRGNAMLGTLSAEGSAGSDVGMRERERERANHHQSPERK